MFNAITTGQSEFKQNQEYQMSRMETNLFKIKKELTETNQDQTQIDSQKGQHINSIQKLAILIQSEYQTYLKDTKFPKDHQTKLNMLLDQQITIGSTVALYQMLFYFREILTEEIIMEIQKKAFDKFISASTFIQKQCLGQLIAQCGYAQQSVVQYFTTFLLQNQKQFNLAFKVLTNMGQIGFRALFYIINQDFESLTNKILDYLSRTQAIIQQIIIPVILSDLRTGSLKEKHTALAIINRLGQFSQSQEILVHLSQLFIQTSVDKSLLISAIRCTGSRGEQYLSSLLKRQDLNQEIRIIIIGAFSWRPKKYLSLRIQSIQYSISNCLLPGKLYSYLGNTQSLFFQQSERSNDSLCLNSRDFAACLQKFVNQTGQPQSSIIFNCLRDKCCQNRSLFFLPQIIKDQNNEQAVINQTIIITLVQLLKCSKSKLREAAVNALGLIGTPQANICLDYLCQCLWDSQPAVRSSAAWAISKFNFSPSKRLTNRFIELLKDNYWKVRTSICQSIGQIIKSQNQPLQLALIKCLKDGSISRQIISRSMIKLPKGQVMLLNYLKNLNPNDFVIRQAIIKSFAEIQLSSQSITLILQQIFKNSKNSRVQIRRACLVVVNSLRKHSNQANIDISYFKLKNILPFYYHFLEDSSKQIRKLASHFILDFGSHAQLIFIQGMTKGSIYTKIQSANCLGKLGVQNFRALILGIRDPHYKVQKASCISIIQNFKVNQVIQHYKQKQNQSISLLCNIKDLVQSVPLQREIKLFLSQVIYNLQDSFLRKDLKQSKLFNDMSYQRKFQESTQFIQNQNESFN